MNDVFSLFPFCPYSSAFAGQRNLDLIPAANTYVQDSRMRNFASTFQTMFYLLILIIKGLMSSVLFSQILGLAWPAVLVGWVAQSASPLQIFRLWYSWAAWATMVSQVVAAFMMIDTLNKKCYNALAISVPMFDGLLRILGLAAPVFITMTSKMHGVLLPFFIALAVTPCNHNLEGTLMISSENQTAAAGVVTATSAGIVDTSAAVNYDDLNNNQQKNVLSLDLNLPAPDDLDAHQHHRAEQSPSKFQFASKQSTKAMMFSAPALVGCHY
ncbi:unnamed protein product [Linum tenue]|uniref:PIN-like protein n=1 Tax=Linum tenue TaxID=586396 RepID=A0AAV0H0U8_9ROSI|nr:unnamed protein product [Linum tenue]